MSEQNILAAVSASLRRPMRYRIVAVSGAVGDWAAYAYDEDDAWTDERIMRYGDKISEDEARRVFPQFEERPYRA